MKRLVIALAAIMVATMPLAASAQSIADTLERWGLVGSWAVDCEKSSNQWMRITYVRKADGSVDHVVDRASAGNTHSPILAAHPNPDGTLEVTVNQMQEIITYVLSRDPGGRVRTISSRTANGTYYIRDSKLVANGNPVPWLTSCR